MGRDQCRAIVKDALTHGKTHLPATLVALVEVEAMRTTQKQSMPLMLGTSRIANRPAVDLFACDQ